MTKTQAAVLRKTERHKPKGFAAVTPVKVLYGFLYIAIIAFVLYSVTALTNINIQRVEKEQVLNDLQSQIQVQEVKNEELQKIKEYTGDDLLKHQEQIARDNGYIKKGERVFVIISGD